MDVQPIRRIACDADAFEAFYLEHVEVVGRFVARRVADPHLAADLTADIFLAAIDAASTYREAKGTPVAWLHGIARNVVAGEVRRQVRELRAMHRLAGHRLLDVDAQLRIEQRLDAERRTRALYDAIKQLPRRDRALLELVAVDGLSISDAASVLGIKPTAARVRLHRARQRLQANTPSFNQVEVTR